MPVIEVNYVAIAVSALASVILGFIWYGPLLGKQWMALSGIAMPAEKPPFSVMIKPIVFSLIGALLMAYNIALGLSIGKQFLGMTGLMCAFMFAFSNWISFVAPVLVSPIAWEGKSWKLFFLHGGYWLVLMTIMSVVLYLWV